MYCVGYVYYTVLYPTALFIWYMLYTYIKQSANMPLGANMPSTHIKIASENLFLPLALHTTVLNQNAKNTLSE